MPHKSLLAGTMSSNEFDDLVDNYFSHINVSLIEGARLVLVDDFEIKIAAEVVGVKRQSLSRTTNKMYQQFVTEELPKCPEGWDWLRVCVPPELKSAITEMVNEAREKYDTSK